MPNADEQGRTSGRRLMLLRHAEAAYGHPGVSDHDAPLSEVGSGAARRLGGYLAECGYRPTHVWCSSARRAQETLAQIAPRLVAAPRVSVRTELYLASPRTLIAHIEESPAEATALLVVGHNPGIGTLAHSFSQGAAPDVRDRIQQGFPPAAFASFTSPASTWGAFEDDRALLDFVVPLDLVGRGEEGEGPVP